MVLHKLGVYNTHNLFLKNLTLTGIQGFLKVEYLCCRQRRGVHDVTKKDQCFSKYSYVSAIKYSQNKAARGL